MTLTDKMRELAERMTKGPSLRESALRELDPVKDLVPRLVMELQTCVYHLDWVADTEAAFDARNRASELLTEISKRLEQKP